MEFKFKRLEEIGEPAVLNDNALYAINNDYLDPHRLLADTQQASQVVAAAALVDRFIDAAEAAGVLEIG